jgi:hypothetical protein
VRRFHSALFDSAHLKALGVPRVPRHQRVSAWFGVARRGARPVAAPGPGGLKDSVGNAATHDDRGDEAKNGLHPLASVHRWDHGK